MKKQERLLKAAERYGKARQHYMDVYDRVDTVEGLDEFDPKYVAWENALYFAEQKKNKYRDALLDLAWRLNR